ncbi:MAG: hypothetical protein SWY16_06810 [Cyanobacteriota bacterium]|nr:hypothetical protein [Cyanobacteriota bacterium]
MKRSRKGISCGNGDRPERIGSAGTSLECDRVVRTLKARTVVDVRSFPSIVHLSVLGLELNFGDYRSLNVRH